MEDRRPLGEAWSPAPRPEPVDLDSRLGKSLEIYSVLDRAMGRAMEKEIMGKGRAMEKMEKEVMGKGRAEARRIFK